MIVSIFAYDVSRDDARARVAALLSHHGVRLQRSVFQAEVSTLSDLQELVHVVTSLIDPATDTVHVFRQCETCWAARREHGQAPPPTDVAYWIV